MANNDIACSDCGLTIGQSKALAEIDVLKADAARYRALRRGQKWSVIDGIGDTLRGDALDAAIDSTLVPNA